MKILKPICCLAAALALVSCGKDEKSSLNYERPIASMRSSLNYGDEESYLGCYLPQEKAEYMRSEDYKSGFIGDTFSKKTYGSSLTAKIEGSEELSREELDELEEQAKNTYGTRFDFTKGQRLNVDFTVNGGEGELCDPRVITVVRYENVWYIYGGVVDEFSFEKK